MHKLRTIFAETLALVAMVMLALPPAYAAEEDQGASFLTPFPDGDIYQVSVIGDGFADGLLLGLIDALGTDVRLAIQKKAREVQGVMSADIEGKMHDLEEAIAKEPMSVAIVMLGEDDRVALKSSTGRKVAVGSADWRTEYTRRIDRLMKAVKQKKAAVYWVGLPNFSRTEANEHAQIMNEVMRERAYLNGFKFIDVYASFADESGGYSAYGPDLTGKIRVLREGDGVHFTETGNRKLAHFVDKELRRDLAQAKNDRTVPLLGTDTEQAKINPEKTAVAPVSRSAAAPSTGAPAGPRADTSGVKIIRAEGPPGAPPSADPSGDQKADNGKISFKSAGAGGREETQTVEILRPAIPASVVALMARRESAGQLGDMIVDQIAGGLTLMSSITPAGNKARGKLSPAQAPYFRLLVKGERLTPKSGRADDVAWPKGDAASDAAKQMGAPQPKG